jgi:hypothetical protein
MRLSTGFIGSTDVDTMNLRREMDRDAQLTSYAQVTVVCSVLNGPNDFG